MSVFYFCQSWCCLPHQSLMVNGLTVGGIALKVNAYITCQGGRQVLIMKEYAESFYKSKTWQDCRNAYARSRRHLCERCLSHGIYRTGEIVHHKTHITPANINDPTITLNFDNLELLCRDCHAQEHKRRTKRVKVDELGRVLF